MINCGAIGRPANDGNTEGMAYATLQFAIDNSTSGLMATPSVINVKDGTYGQTGLTNTGGFDTAILIDSLDFLTIQAVAGHQPVVAPVTGVAAEDDALGVGLREFVEREHLRGHEVELGAGQLTDDGLARGLLPPRLGGAVVHDHVAEAKAARIAEDA